MSHFTYVYDGWKLIDEPRRQGDAALDSLQANPHSDGGDRLPGRKRSQYDPLGTEEAYYVQGPGADEPLTRNPTIGQISYYNQDGNANVTAMTDASGNIIEHYAYDPFGNVTITSSTGMVMSSSSVGNRFLFTGREYIAEIGLYDYRNRVYSPGLGRFLQTDPIRFNSGDDNIYRYCGNDPIDFSDPSGYAQVPGDPEWQRHLNNVQKKVNGLENELARWKDIIANQKAKLAAATCPRQRAILEKSVALAGERLALIAERLNVYLILLDLSSGELGGDPPGGA